MKAIYLFIIAILFSLSACKDMEKIPGNYSINMVQGENFSEYKMTLKIEMSADENKISGYSGCNSYFGTFENPEKNKVVMAPLASSKMMCMEKSKVERTFMQSLNSSMYVNLTPTGIELLDENNNVIITAIKINE